MKLLPIAATLRPPRRTWSPRPANLRGRWARPDSPRARSCKPVTIELRVSEPARKELRSRYDVAVITIVPYTQHLESMPEVVRKPDGSALRIAAPSRAGIGP